MEYLSIDLLIVYAFLCIILWVGWRSGKGTTDIKVYALGRRNFGTAALVLTFLATEVGGQGAVNLAGEIGTVGIVVLLTFLSFSLSYIVQAVWIAPRMVHFQDCLTLGDVMCTLYGRPAQIVSGVCSAMTAACYAGAEVLMLGVVTQSLLGIDARIGMVVGGILLTGYVVHGGMQAVTATDVLQFLVLLVLLPVLAAAALQQVGGIQAMLVQIPSDQLRVWSHPASSYYLMLFLIFGVFHYNILDPALIQRMLMAKSAHQLRQMFLVLAGLFTVVFLVFMVLGTAGHQLYPTLTAEEIVPRMIQRLLPVGLRGLMMAGIIAVVMASIDSYLHTAGLTLVHDVLQPLATYRGTTIREMGFVRYVTGFAGLLIVVLALVSRGKNLYNLILADLEFTTPLLIFPFFGGILGLKSDRVAFYVSSVLTLLVFGLGKWWLPTAYSDFLALICVVVSGVTFLGIHAIRHGGFVIVRCSNLQAMEEHLWRLSRRRLGHWLRWLIPTPRRIISYSQQRVAKYGAPYLLFGAFCCINFTLPYFMWTHGSPVSYELMLYLRVLGGLMCGLLIVRDKWPSSWVAYLPAFWHLTVLYCLPFMSTMMFLLTQGSVEWLINVAVTIMFMVVLVDWVSFTVLSVPGVGLGVLFYRYMVGPIGLDFSTRYLLVYTCFFATLVALLFVRRREQHLAAQLQNIATQHSAAASLDLYALPAVWRIAAMVEQQVQASLDFYPLNTQNPARGLQQEEATISLDFLQYFFSTALQVIQQGNQLMQPLLQVFKKDFIVPHLSVVSLQACIDTILASYFQRHQQHVRIDPSEDCQVHISFVHLQYTMIHVLKFLHAHHWGHQISLRITRQATVHVRLAGQALSQSMVSELFTLFPLQTTAKNLGLAISSLLIEAHSGRLLSRINALPSNLYTEFIIMLPAASAKYGLDEVAA